MNSIFSKIRTEQFCALSSKPIRIANVIEEGKLGGPQVRMVRVAVALSARAETVIVMPQTNSRAFREMCETNGVPHHVLPITRITREWRAALAYVVFSPWELLRLARLFRRERIDLVHASGGSWQYKGVIAAWLVGIPAVWHLNDTSMPSWVIKLFRIVAPLASGFIYTSRSVQEYYGGYIGAKKPFSFVPPPVHFQDQLFDAGICRDEKQLSFSENKPVIVSVGNVSPVKGFETLMLAAARLRDKGYEPHVVIVGAIFDRQRAYHQKLVTQARALGLNSIHFVGGRSDVRAFLARADIYVCSSLSESWGMALWEAMAMSCPVVSTNVGDVSRYLVDGRQGYVVPVGDSLSMAERLCKLIEQPELRAQMARSARELAAAFSPSAIAEMTFEVYQRVINAPR